MTISEGSPAATLRRCEEGCATPDARRIGQVVDSATAALSEVTAELMEVLEELPDISAAARLERSVAGIETVLADLRAWRADLATIELIEEGRVGATVGEHRDSAVLTVESIDGERLDVAAHGHLGAACRPGLAERLARLVSCRPATLHIDFSDVSDVEQEIADLFVRARTILADHGGRLDVEGADPAIREALAADPRR